MANYCTYTDVATLLQLTFDATSQPTNTQVTEIITQVTAEIDTYLNSIGITSQPTNTAFLSMLKKQCGYGSACTVGMTYFGNAQGVIGTQPDYYCINYERFLDKIINKPEIFQKLDGVESTQYLENQVTSGSKTESQINKTYVTNDFTY